MRESTCTKCGGFQLLDSVFDNLWCQFLPQLRCYNCGKVEDVVWQDGMWRKYQAKPILDDGRTFRHLTT